MIIIQKKNGETPLQTLDRVRKEKPELAEEKLSYAGRLDPLAEGEMIVLVGEECNDKNKYTGLDKTYLVDIVFGVETDTHDVLGMITGTSEKSPTQKDIEALLPSFVKTFSQPYPAYSSKPHEGKPLFAHARLGRNIDSADRPHKDVTIYSMHAEKFYTLTVKEYIKIIQEKVNSVSGDFRQKEILEAWDTYFSQTSRETYPVIQVRVHCSSGTYMRVLADEVGKRLGSGAVALHIKREKVHI